MSTSVKCQNVAIIDKQSNSTHVDEAQNEPRYTSEYAADPSDVYSSYIYPKLGS